MAETTNSTPITGLPQSTSNLNTQDLFIISKKDGYQFNSRSISYSTLTSSISYDILPLVPKQTMPIYDTNLPLESKEENMAYSNNTVTKFYNDTQTKIQNLNNVKLDKTTLSKQYVASEVQFNKSVQCPTASGKDTKEVVNVEYLNNAMQNSSVYIKDFWSDGNGWYKLYSNGWLEQGGKQTSQKNYETTINLYLKYRDDRYSIQTTGETPNYGSKGNCGYFIPLNYDKTKDSFKMQTCTHFTGYYWETKGFAEGY